MTDNYAKIVEGNLDRLYADLPLDFAHRLPGEKKGDQFVFEAFGEAVHRWSTGERPARLKSA